MKRLMGGNVNSRVRIEKVVSVDKVGNGARHNLRQAERGVQLRFGPSEVGWVETAAASQNGEKGFVGRQVQRSVV